METSLSQSLQRLKFSHICTVQWMSADHEVNRGAQHWHNACLNWSVVFRSTSQLKILWAERQEDASLTSCWFLIPFRGFICMCAFNGLWKKNHTVRWVNSNPVFKRQKLLQLALASSNTQGCCAQRSQCLSSASHEVLLHHTLCLCHYRTAPRTCKATALFFRWGVMMTWERATGQSLAPSLLAEACQCICLFIFMMI